MPVSDTITKNGLVSTDFGKETLDSSDATPVMSSREIAELTGKQHAHVMRDLRDILVQLHGDDGPSKFGSSYLNSQNKPQPEFLLPKRETLILVSGYSVDLRARIIDRWQELEERQRIDPQKVLSDPTHLRSLLLTHIERELELEGQIEEMRPWVQALERIALSDGSLCVTDAAKTLQVQPKSLFSFLRSHGWIYTPHGGRGDIAYQAKLQAGLLEHKTTTVHRSDGSEKTVTQVRVTAKGLTRLAQELQPAVRAA